MNMKTLKLYITEALHINKNTKGNYHNYHPKDRDEIRTLVINLIKERGNNADLNDIDTSGITDMSYLFYDTKFNGDISEWDVSKVENMYGMFHNSKFNGDISKWDVSKVEDMFEMFRNSKFNGDITEWDVSNVKYMKRMFVNSPLENNPPIWYKE